MRRMPTPAPGASATTGTRPPAGACGTRRPAGCSMAPPAACSTATRAAAGAPQGARAPSVGREPHAVGERGGDIGWCNISGCTDFAGAFIGGLRELPQVPGRMQCQLLGCAVEAWNPAHPVRQEAGAAGQEAAARAAAGESGQPGCDDQSGQHGLVRGAGAAAHCVGRERWRLRGGASPGGGSQPLPCQGVTGCPSARTGQALRAGARCRTARRGTAGARHRAASCSAPPRPRR